jgi:hypothetical protein
VFAAISDGDDVFHLRIAPIVNQAGWTQAIVLAEIASPLVSAEYHQSIDTLDVGIP